MRTIFKITGFFAILLISVVANGQNENLTQTRCAGSLDVYWLNGTQNSTYFWSVSNSGGTVTLGQNTDSISVIWTNVQGTYDLSVVETDSNGCKGDAKTIAVTILPLPTVFAGNAAILCDTNSYTLFGSTASNQNTLLWSTSGTGTFSNTSILHPVYHPSAADVNTGSVTLTIIATGQANCSQVSSTIILTLITKPTVDAGSDTTICASINFSTINATANNYNNLLWTTSGTGGFGNANQLHTIYTPSVNDLAAGQVILRLIVNGNAPCLSIVDSLTLHFSPIPTVFAGNNDSICANSTYTTTLATQNNASSLIWSTSGSGTFSSANSLLTIYTPSTADKIVGQVLLKLKALGIYPCDSAISTKILHIIPSPLVEVGNNDTICSNSTYQISNASASNYSNLTWSTSGTGTFSNTGIINPIYTPSVTDITAGFVKLYLTASGNIPCSIAKDSLRLIIIQLPVVEAGINQTICVINGTQITLSGSSASNYNTLSWSTTGTGGFSNSSVLHPIYTITTADIIAGSIKFILKAYGNLPCQNIVDTITYTLTQGPTLTLSNNGPVCQGSQLSLTSNVAGATYNWTGPNGFTSTSQNPNVSSTALPIMSGIYTLNATNVTGSCPNLTGTTMVTVHSKPITSGITHY
ncbi:MAG: hypothetical protein HXX18_11695 [Bacteroidetes bacterium]|nr:hypothetical protein [Bacteroidota bacterium]